MNINFNFLLYSFGMLIFGCILLCIGFSGSMDFSNFDRKAFIVAGMFSLFGAFCSWSFKFKKIKKYDSLSEEKRARIEEQIKSLNKDGPLIAAIVAATIFLLSFLFHGK